MVPLCYSALLVSLVLASGQVWVRRNCLTVYSTSALKNKDLVHWSWRTFYYSD